MLFIIVVGCPCFKYARKKDYYYGHLVEKDKDRYLAVLGAKINIFTNLTQEFKDLFTKMISYEENDRPKNVQEILDDIWFNEIKENKNELETGLNNLFIEKENKILTYIQSNPDYLEKGEHSFGEIRNLNHGFENEIFPKDITPQSKTINLGMDSHIKIKGNLNYYQFMNTLLDKINKKFENENCCIDNQKSNKKYECDIIFEKDENEEENEEENENETEENNNDNTDLQLNNLKNSKSCTINLELYQSGNEEYVLRFLRLSGSLGEYYSKVNQFICLANELLEL